MGNVKDIIAGLQQITLLYDDIIPNTGGSDSMETVINELYNGGNINTDINPTTFQGKLSYLFVIGSGWSSTALTNIFNITAMNTGLVESGKEVADNYIYLAGLYYIKMKINDLSSIILFNGITTNTFLKIYAYPFDISINDYQILHHIAVTHLDIPKETAGEFRCHLMKGNFQHNWKIVVERPVDSNALIDISRTHFENNSEDVPEFELTGLGNYDAGNKKENLTYVDNCIFAVSMYVVTNNDTASADDVECYVTWEAINNNSF